MSAIGAIQQNTELYTGSTQQAGSSDTIMTSSNLNKSEGTSYSTSNAGSEELEDKKTDKVDEQYIKAALSKLFQGKSFKYRDKYGNVKSIDVNTVMTMLGENKKYSLDKIKNMSKEEFNNLLLCVKAAIEDSIDKDGVIDAQNALRYFTAYSTMALKAGASGYSVQENIEKARKELKEQEGKTLKDKLNGVDINNEEELVKALKEYLNIEDLQKRLSEATTKEEKEEILKGEIREVVKLLHGASGKDMIKVGFALLKAVQGTGLVMVLDAVADMLIPDGLREKFLDLVKENKDLLIKVGGFTDDEIRELSAYLAKNGSFEGNQQNLEALNQSLQKLKPFYEKIEPLWQQYVAEQVQNGRNANEITREEFYEYLRNQNLATDEEIEGHNSYIQHQAELEGMTAGFIGNENLTEDQIQQLIRQAQEIARENGFEEEFLQKVNEYIKTHGDDYNLSESEINQILNSATEGRYGEVTGAVSEATTPVQPAGEGFGLISETSGEQPQKVEQAKENVQNLKEKIGKQTEEDSVDNTSTTVSPALSGETGFLNTATKVVKDTTGKAAEHYASIEAAVRENADATCSKLREMTGEARGKIVAYCFTCDVNQKLLEDAKVWYNSLLRCVKENIANMNLTAEAKSAIKEDATNLPYMKAEDLTDDDREKLEELEK